MNTIGTLTEQQTILFESFVVLSNQNGKSMLKVAQGKLKQFTKDTQQHIDILAVINYINE